MQVEEGTYTAAKWKESRQKFVLLFECCHAFLYPEVFCCCSVRERRALQ